MAEPRKDRKDIRIGKFEEKHGLPPGTMRSKDGKDIRFGISIKNVKTNKHRGIAIHSANDDFEQFFPSIHSLGDSWH
jgi:hypothetical protein